MQLMVLWTAASDMQTNLSRVNESGRVCLGAAMMMILGAGCTDHAIRTLQQSTDQAARFQAASDLGNVPDAERACRALLAAMSDADPAIRYASIMSLDEQLARLPVASLKTDILIALANRLEDSKVGWVSLPTFGPLFPGTLFHTPSVRAAAFWTLTRRTGQDHGLDVSAWIGAIQKNSAAQARPDVTSKLVRFDSRPSIGPGSECKPRER